MKLILKKIFFPTSLIFSIGVLAIYLYVYNIDTDIISFKNMLFNVFWLSFVVYIATLIGLYFFIRQYIHKPMKRISQGTEEYSFVHTLQNVFTLPKSKVEHFAQSLRTLITSLKALVINVNSSNEMSKLVGEKLGKNADTTMDVMKSLSGTAESIKVMTTRLSVIIENNAITMSDMSGNVASLNECINEEAEAVKHSTNTIEDMTRNLGELSGMALKEKESIEGMTSKMSEVKDHVKGVVDNMFRLKDKSAVMLEIVDVIGKISDKTNLLAMNASIEAAHAGQAGSGFKVVANEIKKLAAQSNSNAKQITNHINENLQQIDNSANNGKTILNEFVEVTQIIEHTAKAMVTIIDMVEKLSSSHHDILDQFRQLIKTSDQVKTASDEMTNVRLNVIESISELIGIESSTSEAADKMLTKIKIGIGVVDDINTLTVKTRETIEETEYHLSKFIIKDDQVILKENEQISL